MPALQREVTEWMHSMEALGQQVLSAMAVGLGLDADWFALNLTADPTVLFRIFRYPPHPTGADERWGVAEHSDYGILTLLAHDGTTPVRLRFLSDDGVKPLSLGSFRVETRGSLMPELRRLLGDRAARLERDVA